MTSYVALGIAGHANKFSVINRFTRFLHVAAVMSTTASERHVSGEQQQQWQQCDHDVQHQQLPIVTKSRVVLPVDWTLEQQHFMHLALKQAQEALHMREVPVGCVFVRDGRVIGSGHNRPNHTRNATRHAEIEAIDKILADHNGDAAKVDFPRCQLYVTIEPCIMCAAALSLLGVGQVIYGAPNDKFGGCGSILKVHQKGCGSCGLHRDAAAAAHGHPYKTVGGVCAQEAVALLQEFYIAGNPAAPKPHRPLMEVPPWQLRQQQQQQEQEQEQEQQKQYA